MIPNRPRNDNVSGRVPMSAKTGGTDPVIEDGIQRLAALLREKRWGQARALLAELEAHSSAAAAKSGA